MPKAKDAESNTELVTQYIQKLDKPLANLAGTLRKIILSADKKIGEQIKWGAPCFYYTGDMKSYKPKEHKRDVVVVTVHRGYPLLVFPSGAKVKDTSGFLEGKYTDGRRIAIIKNMSEAKSKAKILQIIIKKCVKLVNTK
jgi:hypothetical protein